MSSRTGVSFSEILEIFFVPSTVVCGASMLFRRPCMSADGSVSERGNTMCEEEMQKLDGRVVRGFCERARGDRKQSVCTRSDEHFSLVSWLSWLSESICEKILEDSEN